MSRNFDELSETKNDLIFRNESKNYSCYLLGELPGRGQDQGLGGDVARVNQLKAANGERRGFSGS